MEMIHKIAHNVSIELSVDETFNDISYKQLLIRGISEGEEDFRIDDMIEYGIPFYLVSAIFVFGLVLFKPIRPKTSPSTPNQSLFTRLTQGDIPSYFISIVEIASPPILVSYPLHDPLVR